MPNMSYCRFENTARAMADCISAIEDNDVSENLSIYEVNGLKDMQNDGFRLSKSRKRD